MRKQERLWRKYGKPEQLEAFKVMRNRYHYELNEEKVKSLSQKVLDAKGDTKQLYKFVAKMTGVRSENPMPKGDSDHSIAENFADYFLNKISKIRESLSQLPTYSPQQKDVPSLDHFNNFTIEEVRDLISDLNTKSSESDILPTKVLKCYLKELLPLITHLINTCISLKHGVFPSKWKEAIVKPLLKKVGLDLEYANYRPVSNLSFLSKVIEKAALNRLNTHVDKNNLLPTHQSAYRRFHSCESALLRLVNDLLCGMEKLEVTALIAIDLSAAFDTVDHDILLEVLNNQYGLQNSTLRWIDSYLRPRACRVNVNTSSSSVRPLECSVPQGSCLGPWLYLTYAGTLFDVIPSDISVHGFADDHTANKRFCPNNQNEEANAISDLEDCALTINSWMNENKLKMNNSKTEFIMFGSRAQLKKCLTQSINIAGETVKSVKTIRYLGAFLDENLSFKDHIKTKSRTAMFNYLLIKSIRKYLDKEATETLVLSLVMSHIDYCNLILYGISKCDLNKLQRIQNMCAKLVLRLKKSDSSKDALYSLHWLPVKARINFKICTFMYNCFSGTAPAYLTEILQKPVQSRSGLRSAKSKDLNYLIPINKKKTFSDRSFSTVGPMLWNKLPDDIKLSPTLDVFKKRLKTHYFSTFYDLF